MRPDAVSYFRYGDAAKETCVRYEKMFFSYGRGRTQLRIWDHLHRRHVALWP